MLNKVNDISTDRYQPDGFNIGINVGEKARQTVNHVHIHLIPRYTGDVDDPRGGVRGVIPDKKS
jgi:diadenosine tetraphosphate (Ap4A) HIT family hydrolase